MGYSLEKVDSDGKLSKKALKTFQATLQKVPGERDCERPRLNWLRGLLRSGEFNRCEWAQCLVKENKKKYRVNGQHSSVVLQEVVDEKLEADFPDGVPIIMSYWIADTMDDLLLVFDQFDQHRSVRSAKDKLGVYSAFHDDIEAVGKKFCGALLVGIAWGCKRIEDIKEFIPVELVPSDAYERGKLLNSPEVREFILTMFEYVEAPSDQWMQKPGTIAAFFKLFLQAKREDFMLIIEQTLYEVGDLSLNFNAKIRSQCKKKVRDSGHFYNDAVKYIKGLTETLTKENRAEIKRSIREVQKEQEEEEEDNVENLEEVEV